MTTADAVVTKARELIAASLEAGDTLPKLAMRAGLSRNGLKRWQCEDWNPTVATLRGLEAAAIMNGRAA